MKKTLFNVGAASMMLAMFATGCASTEKQPYGLEVQTKIAELKGLEDHVKQPEKCLLPNLSLNQTKALYISWAAVATDSAVIRFGEADVVSVIRDATDSNNLGLWDAMRNSDTDKKDAADAITSMKTLVAQSYAKNKTTSKLSDDAMFETVVAKMAQEDYIAYKKGLKEGKKDSDFANQKEWLAKGKANIDKVAAENKKMLEAAEKRLAKAEKEVEESKRKISLTMSYAWKKAIELPVSEAGVAAAKVAAEKAVPQAQAAVNNAAAAVKDAEAKVNSLTNAFAKSAAEKALNAAKQTKIEADKALEEAKNLPKKAQEKVEAVKKEIAAIKAEFPEVDTVFELPNLKFDPTDMASVNAAGENLKKELAPWGYALEMAGKRGTAVIKAKSLAREAQGVLDEVSGEK